MSDEGATAGVGVGVGVDVRYLSAGANRHTAVADWSEDGIVAFGADCNVALWRPNVGLSPPPFPFLPPTHIYLHTENYRM